MRHRLARSRPPRRGHLDRPGGWDRPGQVWRSDGGQPLTFRAAPVGVIFVVRSQSPIRAARRERTYRRAVSSPGMMRIMQISLEGKIGYGIGTFGLFGAAASLIGTGITILAPSLTWIGWVLIGAGALTFFAAVMGMVLLAMHHFNWSWSALKNSFLRHRRLVIGSAVICGALLFGPYYLSKVYGGKPREKPERAVNSPEPNLEKGNIVTAAPLTPLPSFENPTSLLPQTAPRAETATPPPPIARSPEPNSLPPEKANGNCPPGFSGINVHGLDVERSGGNGIVLGEHSSVCLDGVKSLDNHGQGFLIQPDTPAKPEALRPSSAPSKPPRKK